jgi:hypothetical protein
MCGTFQVEMRRLRPVTTFALLFATSAVASCADDSNAGLPGAMEDYVPDAPIAYDGRYLDGSFEGNLGTGWDMCATKTPGKPTHPTTGGAQGSSYLRFEAGGCEGVCAATNPSAAQAYAWFSAAPSATAKMGLYFDVLNAGGSDATGALRFYGTDLICQQDSVLAEIDLARLLARLPMSATWSTRCVTVTGPGADTAIGLSVSGGAHQIGIDALRLGPPCH